MIISILIFLFLLWLILGVLTDHFKLLKRDKNPKSGIIPINDLVYRNSTQEALAALLAAYKECDDLYIAQEDKINSLETEIKKLKEGGR